MKEWNPYDQLKESFIDIIMQDVLYGNPEKEPGETESGTYTVLVNFLID